MRPSPPAPPRVPPTSASLPAAARRPALTALSALAALGVASAPATGGCGTTSAVTTRASLARARLASLEVSLAPAEGLCPGFAGQLRVVAVTRDGRHLPTPLRRPTAGPAAGLTAGPGAPGDRTVSAPGPPSVSWANYDIAVRGGVASPTGWLRVTAPPRRLLERPAEVTVTSIHHPEISGHLTIPTRWGCPFVAHFDGRPGHVGRSGGPGLSVEGTLSVLETADGRRLARLVLRAPATGRSGEILFDPAAGGSVLVSARGGAGGPGRPGHHGAPGGRGGTVRLTIDPAARSLAAKIRVDVRGGDGGRPGDARHASGPAGPDGPPPVLRPGPVWEP